MNRWAIILLAACAMTAHGQWHVSTTGTENPNGTQAQPWSWIYAMGGADHRIQPGDTVYFHGGVYGDALTDFGYGTQGYFVELLGTADRPCVVRPWQNDLVRFQISSNPAPAVVTFYGHDFEFHNMVVECTGGSSQVMDGIRIAGPDHGVADGGARTKVVNCIILNATNNGIADQDAEGTELYGNVILYSGRRTSGGNAYAVYGQNHFAARKRYEQNVFGTSFAQYVLHMYGSEGGVDFITLADNAVFNTVGAARIMFSSASTDCAGIELIGNMVWGRAVGETIMMERKGMLSPVYDGNVFARGLIEFRSSTTGRDFRDNYAWGSYPVVTTSGGSPPWPLFDIATEPDNTWRVDGQAFDLNTVRVLKNKYQAGRALVVIYNAATASSVPVDLSGVILGNFTVKDAQNPLGPDVFDGTFTGTPIAFPVTQNAVPAPQTQHPEFPAPTHTGREFAVFIVTGEPDPLPIVMGQITAELTQHNQVLIRWQTFSEANTYGFTVQRRFIGDPEFIDVGFVPAAGWSTMPRIYEFIDSMLYSPGLYEYQLLQADLDGSRQTFGPVAVRVTSIAPDLVPAAFSLAQNYPNPFNPSTRIEFSLPRAADVELRIIDAAGRSIQVIVSAGQMPAGWHHIDVDGSDLATGVYLYRLTAAGKSLTRKMLIIH